MTSDCNTPKRTSAQGTSRSHYRYPTGKPKHTLELTGDVIADNNVRCRDDLWTFKENVKWVCFKRGYSLTQVVREMRAHGVRVRRETLFERDLRRYPSAIYISTFARVLGVPTWMLLHPDIESVFQP